MHRRIFASGEKEVVLCVVVDDVYNNLDARDTPDLLTAVLIVDIIILNVFCWICGVAILYYCYVFKLA